MNEDLRIREKYEEIRNLLNEKEYRALRGMLNDMLPYDISVFMSESQAKERALIYRILSKELAAEVFAYLDGDIQHQLISSFSEAEIASVLDELFLDDTVDFLEEMPAYIVDKVLKVLSKTRPETRQMINMFLKYPFDSAGSIMTIEYVSVNQNYTVEDAISKIRRVGLNKETVYTIYVTNENRILEGVVSLRKLLFANNGDIIGHLMDSNLIYAYTNDDQEKISALFRKYGLLSLPILDKENRLVGIVTVDDIVDVIEEENTEDFEKMAALRPSEKTYLKSSVWDLAKNRLLWLLVLMASGMLIGLILGAFEKALVVGSLVVFMPMITGTGGNAGSQASTLVIRGMALGEISSKDYAKVLWKELRVALSIGIILGAFNFVRIVIQYRNIEQDPVKIAFIVAISLVFTVVAAKITGGMLPMLAKKIKVDPALMAAPLISTILDAVGLVFYFGMATLVLGL
ncbi:MAG: magnesium transporter [Clostridiales bacterium]|jgi:magnesium transporter|nr:magnesium transporter [Clostridiales bacterium]